MTKIFISYRREDSADVTGRIGDRLRDYFGEEQIFTDVDNIPLGVDFRSHLDNEVSQCNVLLAVIGKDWLSARNSDNELRLHDPADFVRVEIESALRRDIPVIPLLVRGASVPPSNQLPESIKELAYRNAQKIRPDPDFKNDANRLVKSLVKHFESNTPGHANTITGTQEGIDESRVPADRWQFRKSLGLGVVISSISAVFFIGWYMFGIGQDVEPESQQSTQLPEIGKPSQDPETQVTDFILPDMVEVPAGSFMMGSEASKFGFEQPVHEVTVPAFELARHELTWAEWQACEEAYACSKIERPFFFENIETSEQGRHPVVNAIVADINDYLTWISGRTGRSYRLPSEAEWEFAARASSTTAYYWGDDIGENRANCAICGSQWDGESTAPVGSFDANSFGLTDLHGNVQERVADCWHETYNRARSVGSAWVDSCTYENTNVLRGGSWYDSPERLYAWIRFRIDADIADDGIGFRIARSLP